MSVNVSGNIISSTGFDASANILNSQRIVTDGLVLWLDAGNFSSYNGSANYYDCGYGCQYYASNPGCTNCNTQIKDMSGFGNDGTFLNGASVTYSNIGGSLNLVGASATAVSTPLATQFGDFSVVVWFKDEGSESFARLVDKHYANGFALMRYSTAANTWGGSVLESADPYGIYLTLTDGNWHCLTSIRNGTTHTLYGDGITNTISNTVSSAALGTEPIYLGGWTGNGTAQRFTGKMPIVMVYNRALSSAEALQNFNADRQRFGI